MPKQSHFILHYIQHFPAFILHLLYYVLSAHFLFELSALVFPLFLCHEQLRICVASVIT